MYVLTTGGTRKEGRKGSRAGAGGGKKAVGHNSYQSVHACTISIELIDGPNSKTFLILAARFAPVARGSCSLGLSSR